MIGYTLSTEEFPASKLANLAQQAEAHGFDFVGMSDHFHPWISKQGNAPFAWTAAGAVMQATRNIQLLMEVTCPILRYHPAIVAQAAMTVQELSAGRFLFGLGSGENLNEHIVGQGWPPVAARQDMLREAIEIIRQLFTGKQVSFYGVHFTVEQARLYSLADTPPPLIIAASGPKAARIAGEQGDGLVGLAPDKSVVGTFRKHGGKDKPTYAQVSVCYAPSVEEAGKIAFTFWPNTGLKGPLSTELRLPEHFEAAIEMLTPESATESIVLGPDADEYVKTYKQYRDAGYDHVYFHQIGPDQLSFMKFYKQTLKKLFT